MNAMPRKRILPPAPPPTKFQKLKANFMYLKKIKSVPKQEEVEVDIDLRDPMFYVN
jgi:hypothetical protein